MTAVRPKSGSVTAATSRYGKAHPVRGIVYAKMVLARIGQIDADRPTRASRTRQRAKDRHADSSIVDIVACVGHLDLGAQGQVTNLLRTDTPRAIRLSALRASA
jgi:hypothetical protein